MSRRQVHDVDAVPLLGEPGGMNTRCAAHVQDTRWGEGKVTVKDLPGPHQLNLAKPGGKAALFPKGLVMPEDCLGVFHTLTLRPKGDASRGLDVGPTQTCGATAWVPTRPASGIPLNASIPFWAEHRQSTGPRLQRLRTCGYSQVDGTWAHMRITVENPTHSCGSSP